jgi:hypothetical protein
MHACYNILDLHLLSWKTNAIGTVLASRWMSECDWCSRNGMSKLQCIANSSVQYSWVHSMQPRSVHYQLLCVDSVMTRGKQVTLSFGPVSRHIYWAVIIQNYSSDEFVLQECVSWATVGTERNVIGLLILSNVRDIIGLLIIALWCTNAVRKMYVIGPL